MTRVQFVAVAILSMAAIVMTVGRVANGNSGSSETEVNIALRNVAHRLLLSVGDSSSRVLPVQKITATFYELEFQGRFGFVPDSLVKIVHSALTAGSLPLNYTVSVLECRTAHIVYGYRIGSEKTTLVPCLGRVQPRGCYVIQIEFLKSPLASGNLAMVVGAVLSAVAACALVLYRKKNPTTLARMEGGVPIGAYSFYPDRRLLWFGESHDELTDKESALLAALVNHPNEVMERQRLLKEVWGDEQGLVGRRLDVFVSRLRKKLARDTSVRIVNIHGKGYSLEIDRS